MRRSIAAVAFSALLMPALARGAAPSPTLEPPPELVTMLDRGPSGGLDGLRAFLGGINPMLGLMLTGDVVDNAMAKAVGLESLAPFDRNGPIYLLYVEAGHAEGFVLVGRLADRNRLSPAGNHAVATRRGWAAVGPSQILKSVEDWALEALPAQAPSRAPTLTVYIAHAFANHRADFQKARAEIANEPVSKVDLRALSQALLDGFESLSADGDRLQLTLDASRKQAALELAITARPNTRLEQFFKCQRPSDYALLDKLPGAHASDVSVKQIKAGPYLGALHEFMSGLLAAMKAPPELVQLDDLMFRDPGEESASITDVSSASTYAYLFRFSASAGTEAKVSRLLASLARRGTFRVAGIQMKLRAVRPKIHDGVSVRGYQLWIDPKALPSLSRADLKLLGKMPLRIDLALFDQLGVFTLGKDAEAEAERTIDAARGKGARYTPSKEVADSLAASRARKESAAMVMDLGPLFKRVNPAAKLGGALVATVGFAHGSAHVRLSMSSTTVRQLLPQKAAR